MTKRFVRGLPTVLLALALPVAAQAADGNATVSKEVATASAHAGMAMGATDLAMAHAHLQHVVNCLVGPEGQSFDAKAENPCKGMGRGAMTDAQGDALVEGRLRIALSQAEQGLTATTLEAAHAEARKAMETLQAK